MIFPLFRRIVPSRWHQHSSVPPKPARPALGSGSCCQGGPGRSPSILPASFQHPPSILRAFFQHPSSILLPASFKHSSSIPAFFHQQHCGALTSQSLLALGICDSRYTDSICRLCNLTIANFCGCALAFHGKYLFPALTLMLS